MILILSLLSILAGTPAAGTQAVNGPDTAVLETVRQAHQPYARSPVALQQEAVHLKVVIQSELLPGDLIVMDTQDELSIWSVLGFWNDHVAMYVGTGQFIHACGAGVDYVMLDELRTWAKNFAYLRVDATPEQREDAVAFVHEQIGREYQNSFLPPYFCVKHADPNHNHPTADMFYCTELVWAAYYNQGIDIDLNGWFPTPETACVFAGDILNDNDVEMITQGAPPPAPPHPSGPTELYRFEPGLYCTSGVNRDHEDAWYEWDWELITGPWRLVSWGNHDTVCGLHAWCFPGVYEVRVRAMDIFGYVGPWSEPLTVTVRPWLGDG